MVAATKHLATLYQKWFLKTWVFVQKLKNFVHFGPYYFVQISPVCGPSTYQLMFGETIIPVSAFATAARKSFNGKFTTEIDF